MNISPVGWGAVITVLVISLGYFAQQVALERRSRLYSADDFHDRSFRVAPLSYIGPLFGVGFGVWALFWTKGIHPDGVIISRIIGVGALLLGFFTLYIWATSELRFADGRVIYRVGRKVVREFQLSDIRTATIHNASIWLDLADGKRDFLPTGFSQPGLVLAMLRKYRP